MRSIGPKRIAVLFVFPSLFQSLAGGIITSGQEGPLPGGITSTLPVFAFVGPIAVRSLFASVWPGALCTVNDIAPGGGRVLSHGRSLDKIR